MRICDLAGRNVISSLYCVCLSVNGRRRKVTLLELRLLCIRLCTGYFSQVVEQLHGENDYCLREQCLSQYSLGGNECEDYALRYCSPARLCRCIRSANKGSHATQLSVYVFYKKSFCAVPFLLSTFLGEKPLCAEANRTFKNSTANADVTVVAKGSTDEVIL